MRALTTIISQYFSPAEKGVRQLTWGNAQVQALALLTYPLLQYFYLPEAFGRFGLLTSIVVVVASLATLRLDVAIVLGKHKAADLVQICLLLLAITALLLCVPLFFTGMLPLKWQQQAWFLPWLPAAVFMAGVINVGTYYLTFQHSFAAISRLRVGQKGAALALQLLIGIAVGSTWGLVAGFMAGLLVGVALVLPFLPFHRPQFGQWWAIVKRFRDFIQWGLPQSMLDMVSSKVGFLLIPFLFGYKEAGWYAAAALLLSLPEAVIGTSVGQVFYSKMAAEKDPLQQYGLIRQTWRKLSGIGLVLFLLAGAAALSFITLYPNSPWAGAGETVVLLLPAFFLTFIALPTSTALTVFRKQHLALYFGGAYLVGRPLMLLIGWWFDSYFLSLACWTLFEIIQLFVYLRLVAYTAKNRCATTAA